MVEQIIIVFHVLVALGIIGLVLLQQGKGADMGASFGGGGSQTLFGPSGGGNVLTRATAVLAFTFFVTSFALAIIAKQKASEVSSLDPLFSDAAIEQVEEEAAARSALEQQLEQIPDTVDDAVAGAAGLDDAALDIVDSLPQ